MVIVLLLIIALFLPDGYFIEKSAIIKKPCDFVMDKVADFHNHILWNPISKIVEEKEWSYHQTYLSLDPLANALALEMLQHV